MRVYKIRICHKCGKYLLYELRRRPIFGIGLLLLLLALMRAGMRKQVSAVDPSISQVTGTVKEITVRSNGVRITLKTEAGDLLVYGPEEPVQEILNGLYPGYVIRMQGTLKTPEPATNPGQFDFRKYYEVRGILGTFFPESIQILKEKKQQPQAFLHFLRRKCHDALGIACADQQIYEMAEPLLDTMLLGEKSTVETEIQDLYRSTGMAHMLAISGLHLSILGWGLYRLLRRGRVPLRPAAGIASVTLGLYVLLVGAGPSALRAYLFFLLTMVSQVLGRGRDLPTAWMASYGCMVTWNPFYLYDSGFHLSFVAVGSLCMIVPLLHPFDLESRYPKPEIPTDRWQVKLFRMGKKMGHSIGLAIESAAVLQLCMLPVMAYYFYEVPVYGLLLNLFLLPTVSVVLVSGVVATAVAMAGIPLSGICLYPAAFFLRLYETCASFTLRLPGHTLLIGKPAPWQMVLYGMGMAAAVFCVRKGRIGRDRRHRLVAPLPAVLLLMASLWIIRYQPDSHELILCFLDIGQGDCIFLQTPEQVRILVDCGSSNVKEPGKNRLIPFLKSQGIGKLDYVFLTHEDMDHRNGIEELFASDTGIQVSDLVLTAQTLESEAGQQLKRLALARGTHCKQIEAGQQVATASCLLQCLFPTEGEIGHGDSKQVDANQSVPIHSDPNAGSLVLQVTYGNFRALLTGDLGIEQEQTILPLLQQVTLLKAGHHGSSGSSGLSFLEKTEPAYTVISCGRENRYGHPHRETLERMEQVHSQIFRTDQQGCIRVETNGKQMTIGTYL